MKHVGEIPDALRWENGVPVCHTDRRISPTTKQIGKRKWEILFPFASRVDELITLCLPGFQYDGFSVPKLLWFFQSPMTGYSQVTPDHDGGYGSQLRKRKLWDYRIQQLLLHYGETDLRTGIIHRRVRRWGWWAWRRKTDEILAFYRKHFLLFAADEADQLKRMIVRYNAIAYLRIEKERSPNNHAFLEGEIRSIKHGDIDEILLRTEQAH